MLVSNRTDFEHLQMSMATLIILILLLAIIVGITIVVKMALSKLNPAPRPNNPSPAPATGGSKTSSGGGDSSGKNGTWIGYFLITTILATLWLIIRGLVLSPPSHYNGIELGILIVVFVLTAINILFGKGGSKWISLVLAVVMGCIIWGNYNYINSSNPPPEQSVGQQEQVAPAPVEEMPSTERMVWAGKKILLAGDGEYLFPKGEKSLCITALGMKDGSTLVPQDITIGGISYNTLGSKCQELPAELEGRVIVDFSPGKPWGTKEAIINIYKEYDSKTGGIGELPFIAIGM